MMLYWDYPTEAGVAMTAAGAEGHVGGMGDGGGSETRESFRRNVRTKRTKRTKPVGRELMERMRTAVQPACQVCAGIGILAAEENAATDAGRGDGMGRQGNGHGI
jgi:tartrate dehydratase alpha subunit/fumarate hydratase class I-like protein